MGFSQQQTSWKWSQAWTCKPNSLRPELISHWYQEHGVPLLDQAGVVAWQTSEQHEFWCVKAPSMVGPTWTRVCLTLGSDCFSTLLQGTGPLLSHVLCYIHCLHVHVWCSEWYRVVPVHCIHLWAPEGCCLFMIWSAYMVSCIPWQTDMFTIGGERRGLHLLMLCRLPYNSITDSHCTWVVVLWPLVQ